MKMWCEKDLEAKRKLRYYKEVINPTLEDQKYLFFLTSSVEAWKFVGNNSKGFSPINVPN